MELFILPSLDVVKAEMGFEPWEEVDGYSLLYKQGQEGYQIEVEDGETFEIPEDSEGQILDDDTIYFWKTEPIDDEFADEFYDEFGDTCKSLCLEERH